MDKRLNTIQQIFSELNGISIETPFSSDLEFNIVGKIKVPVESTDDYLFFDVKIYPEYPLKRMDTESITFSNSDYLEYGHVMGDGSICIHTSHHTDLKKKIEIDINSLKRWIWKYYLNKDNDKHYEHLILQPKEFKGNHFSFLFTEVDHVFSNQQFGFFEYSKINNGLYHEKIIKNNLIQEFRDSSNKKLTACNWSSSIQQLTNKDLGIYIFLDNPPAKMGKFIISKWEDLEGLVNQNFHSFLYSIQKKNLKLKGKPIPFLIGYRISDKEIHWQVAILEIGNFPIETYKENKVWKGKFINEDIIWGITKNCSYDYFFGKGRLNEKITKSKILIIGIGAIGSMVATTLTRCGCTSIDVVDYDIKEPENVCRSEYSFLTGICNKVDDLSNELFSISPFVEIGIINPIMFHLDSKIDHGLHNSNNELQKKLLHYDMIIDCSTDNDLLYVLSKLELNRFITLSITNNAKELVCSVEPNSYNWVMNQYENVLENEMENLHNPTGCWSPTFKASYNDINTLVQFAIKHINIKLSDDSKSLRNFVLKTNESDVFSIKLDEF
ncbi:ThiF family adenylyltransferase [Flavobacterium macacae]|uniref:Thiamine biosynthesis protein ThiF n=1 Tax=Flavobacterium macacae TaxID=2488993 RepID=A0A3P3WJC1_9FLAO|nr:ThiF family adenylyltransferase [Flavobacterium macacae]RRJ92873.1 thiamine biosynthesis protein ThiF [Flavobacterium macacae]